MERGSLLAFKYLKYILCERCDKIIFRMLVRKNISKRYLTILALLIFCSTIFIFQVFGISRDFVSYERYFNYLRGDLSLLSYGTPTFEPLFYFIAYMFSHFIANNKIVYLLILLSCIHIKSSAFYSITNSKSIFTLVILFYMVRFFPLHEMTQIRTALATSFLLYAIPSSKKFVFFATLSHYSSIVVAPFYLIKNKLKYLLLLVPVIILLCSISWYFLDNIITNIFPEGLSVRILLYLSDEPADLISTAITIDLIYILFGLTLWNKSPRKMKFSLLMCLVGISMYYGNLNYSGFASRLHQIFSVFLCPYLIYSMQLNKQARYMAFLFIIINIIYYSFIYFYYAPFFK